MSRRRYRARPCHVIAAGAAAVLLLWLAAHLLLSGLVLATIAAGAYRLGLSRRPVTRAIIAAPDPRAADLARQVEQMKADARQLLYDFNADIARVRTGADAEIAALRAELEAARASACAAWDQAATARPPRRSQPDEGELRARLRDRADQVSKRIGRDELLSDALSGAHSLGGQP